MSGSTREFVLVVAAYVLAHAAVLVNGLPALEAALR